MSINLFILHLIKYISTGHPKTKTFLQTTASFQFPHFRSCEVGAWKLERGVLLKDVFENFFQAPICIQVLQVYRSGSFLRWKMAVL